MTVPRLRRHGLLWLSALALFLERLWPRLWPLAAVIGSFLAVALTDLLPQLPPVAHVLVLAAFAAAALAAAVYALPALRRVRRDDALRRLDHDAATGHRPLATSEDRLAAGDDDPFTAALWARHQQRMAAAARQLRVRWPAADMARREPWGIRAFVVLLLVIGGAAAGSDWRPRLLRAVTPAIIGAGTPVSVELWITPPAYTHRPPIFLRAGGGDAPKHAVAIPAATPASPELSVPAGSRLEGRVTGTGSTPRLRLGEVSLPFTSLASDATAPASYRLETTITGGDRLAVRAGWRELAGWSLRVVADAPPKVSFLDPPAAKGNGLLGLAYQATDDYGVSEVSALLRRIDANGKEGEDELRLPLALTEPDAPVVTGHDLQDLAAHPWAGQAVAIRIAVRDGIGQAGLSTQKLDPPVQAAGIDPHMWFLRSGNRHQPMPSNL